MPLPCTAPRNQHPRNRGSARRLREIYPRLGGSAVGSAPNSAGPPSSRIRLLNEPLFTVAAQQQASDHPPRELRRNRKAHGRTDHRKPVQQVAFLKVAAIASAAVVVDAATAIAAGPAVAPLGAIAQGSRRRRPRSARLSRGRAPIRGYDGCRGGRRMVGHVRAAGAAARVVAGAAAATAAARATTAAARSATTRELRLAAMTMTMTMTMVMMMDGDRADADDDDGGNDEDDCDDDDDDADADDDGDANGTVGDG